MTQAGEPRIRSLCIFVFWVVTVVSSDGVWSAGRILVCVEIDEGEREQSEGSE